MSRSQPETNEPNPAVRWFEWSAGTGVLHYYDKVAKTRVEAGAVLPFLLLDQVASISGYHKPSGSGIYSNAVRDTTRDVLVVKAHKAGTLAEGLYQSIKDKVGNLGGHYTTVCYIAAKINGTLEICALPMKGAALTAWIKFKDEHKSELYDHTLVITGAGPLQTSGKVKFHAPVFALKDALPESVKRAEALDKELQTYLKGYFERTSTRARAEQETDTESDSFEPEPVMVPEEDLPF